MKDKVSQHTVGEDCIKQDDAAVKQKTMNLSITEGSFAVVASAIGDNYLVPYALALNSTTAQVGMMTSLSGFMTPMGQLIGSHLMKSRSRRLIAVVGSLIQACTWVFVATIGFFQWEIGLRSFLPLLLILTYTINIIAGAVSGPPWFSLMGDIVPEDKRGRYFAKRNVIVNTIAICVILSLSFLLQVLKNNALTILGFVVIFLLAFGSRLTSSSLLNRHYYPPFTLEKGEYVKLWDFLKEVPKSNFGHFVLLACFVNFGQMIAGPFFSVHMIENLDFSYETYIIVNLSSSISAVILYPFLGMFSDKWGNIRMLRIGACIIPALPLFWIFLTDPFTLILFPQLLAGLGWTAFNLAASNFIYDSVSSHKRGFYVAYYNFLVGVGILVGGIVGSVLINTFPDALTNFQFVFLVSTIVRSIAVAIFLPRIKEVRKITARKPVSKFYGFRTARGLFMTAGFENLWKKRNHSHIHSYSTSKIEENEKNNDSC